MPKEVQPYVSLFLAEAGKRGHRLVIDDLVISYKFNLLSSKTQAAGLCRKRYGHTPMIFIDTTSANWRTSDFSREQLVFHELCHCILNRGHNNDTLLNGNPASIMKPTGETLYGSVLNEFKREYYIDEMFDKNVGSPAWAQINETYTSPYAVLDTLFFDNFTYAAAEDIDLDSLPQVDSALVKNWSLGENTVVRREITDDRLELQSYVKGSYIIPFEVNIPDNTDFEIRFNMAIPGGKDGNMTFYWGGSSVKDPFAIIINQDGFVSIGQISKGIVTSKPQVKVFNDVFNEILIRKVGNAYYLFVNGRLIDNLKFEPLNGPLFGIGVSGQSSEVWVDDILVNTIGKIVL
ncbi:MAG TPA: hypothetical protein VLZ75_09785 [Chitinophagales bacterium]|nr:hypothetical protein [Chitinophagales bacterium]